MKKTPICTKTTCVGCDVCVYDEYYSNYKSDNSKYMVKQNDLTKITCCNECPKSVCHEADSSGGIFNNWYCKTKEVSRLLEMSVLGTFNVKIPSWCPLGLCKNEKKEEPKKDKYTYAERMKMWESIKEITSWDNIKPNTIYHVPPVLNEKRKDILVTVKTDFSFSYRELQKDKPASSAIFTIYKTNIWWKFMSEHKLRKVEAVNYNTIKK